MRSPIRSAGLVACLVGVLVMLTGRFVAGAPVWLVWPGLAIIAAGWVLLALSAVRRPAS